MSNNITPFVKRMRTQGGTFYTFSSAIEDIGLNINEKNNIVEMSNFALLDIPTVTSPTNIVQNKFNVFASNGGLQNEELTASNIKDGRIVIAESFQNYALNLESNLLNRPEYNPSILKTVSERVFWKWLKETGAIRWIKDVNNPLYWVEESILDSSTQYNSIVKYIGQVSAGAVRTNNHGTYNETYILIPTSHGKTRVYFNQNFDDNYLPNLRIGPGSQNILGRENYTQPHPDALSLLAQYDYMDSSTQIDPGNWDMFVNDGTGYVPGSWYSKQGIKFIDNYYYATDISGASDVSLNYNLKYFDGAETIEFARSNVDGIEIEFDINKLRDIYQDNTLTYDKIAIENAVSTTFNFNAVLVYYSIYNKTRDKKLATNLLGILFLDPASGNTAGFPDMNINIANIVKLQSTSNGFGSSYSFRINIKSNNMLDDTQAVIIDDSTSSQTDLENWAEVFNSLSKSLDILNQHTSTINYITEQYLNISSIQTQQNNLLSDLQYQVNDVAVDITGTHNTLALFANGNDPLVDSSIYMRFGKVGIFNNDPKYNVDIVGDVKLNNIIFEKNIKDVSYNDVLSYSDSIDFGSKFLAKNFKFYSGNQYNVVEIDSSGNIIVANIYSNNITGNYLNLNNSLVVNEDLTIGNNLIVGSNLSIGNNLVVGNDLTTNQLIVNNIINKLTINDASVNTFKVNDKIVIKDASISSLTVNNIINTLQVYDISINNLKIIANNNLDTSTNSNILYLNQNGIVLKGYGPYSPYSSLTPSTSITWDCSYGLNKTLDISTNFTLNITNSVNGNMGKLILNDISTGVLNITLPARSKKSPTSIDFSSVSTGYNEITWIYDGSTYYFKINKYV